MLCGQFLQALQRVSLSSKTVIGHKVGKNSGSIDCRPKNCQAKSIIT